MGENGRHLVLSAVSTLVDMDHDALAAVSRDLFPDKAPQIGEILGLPVWELDPGAPEAQEQALQPAGGLLRVGAGRIWFCGGARALATPDKLVARVIESLAEAAPTEAEARLALRLLEGHDLASAARADAVGHETRRSQFKSLAAKLQVRRQHDVVRVLSESIVARLSALRAPSRAGQHWRAYAAAHLPQGMRVHVLEDAQGNARPVLDYGPQDGDPVLVLHPMFLPRFEPEDLAYATDRGLRLIWPARPGLIDPDAPWQSAEAHVADAVRSTFACWQAFVGRPCPVVALVSSASTAVGFAKTHPEAVSAISFGATCYSAGRHLSNPRYFGADLAELALRQPAVLGPAVAALRRMSTPERFEATIQRLFRGSAPDQAELTREFALDGGRRLRDAVLLSPESVRHDYFNQVHFHWSEAAALTVPMSFVHGAEDRMHPPEGVAELAKTVGTTRYVELPDTGHLPHGAHLRSFLDAALQAQRQGHVLAAQ